MKKCIKCKNDMMDNENICIHCGINQTKLYLKRIMIWTVVSIMMIGGISTAASNYEKQRQQEKYNRNSKTEEIIDNNDQETNIQDSNNTNEDIYNTSYDTSKLLHITVDDLKTTLTLNDNKKYFILSASPYCSHCIEFIPKVNRSLEDYSYAVEYIDMSTLTTNEINLIRNQKGFTSFGSTPIVYVVQNGIAIDSSIGNVDYYNYLDFIESHGVKKKNNSDEIVIESVK